MAPTIRVSEEVYKELQALATPFVDTPDDVLRRVLGINGQDHAKRVAAVKPVQPIARRSSGRKFGEGIPMTEYRPYILKALLEKGGRAPLADVKDHIRKRVQHRFDKHDLELTESNAVVWENRVEWQRLEMRHDGLISSSSPRGIWELTPTGLAEAKKLP